MTVCWVTLWVSDIAILWYGMETDMIFPSIVVMLSAARVAKATPQQELHEQIKY